MNYYRYKTLRAIALTRFWNYLIFITLILFSLIPLSASAQQFVEIEDLGRVATDLERQSQRNTQSWSGLPPTDLEKLLGEFAKEQRDEGLQVLSKTTRTEIEGILGSVTDEVEGEITGVLSDLGVDELESVLGGLTDEARDEISKAWGELAGDELENIFGSSAGNVFDDLLGDVFSPIDSFIDEVFEEINPIIDSVKGVYAEINSGLDGVVTTVLGEIGLANPQAESNNTGWTERSPYYNPKTATDVARRAEAADAQKAQVLERLAQVIFGKRGQEVINQQNVLLGQTQTVSGQATAAIGNTSQVSTGHAAQNVGRVSEVARQASIASSARVTQDVMKAIAAQNEEIANINVGISEQLALIGEGQLYNGMQMNGLTTQLTIANQRSQNMETFLAAQNSQLAEIDSNQELAMKREIERENQARTRDRQGMTRIFIPGLFESETLEATARESSPSNTLPELPQVNTLFKNLSDNLNQ